MSLEIRRQRAVDPTLPVRWLDSARGNDFDDAYVLLRDDEPRWQAVTCWGEHAHVPFREEVLWESRGVAVVGGGAAVHFLDLENGAPLSRLDISCLFGGLALDEGESTLRPETLYVLGWTDIFAIDATLQARWRLRDVAVDGIVFRDPVGSVLRFSVEMDPPGGWFAVEVDAATGRELSRKPAFTDDYVGLYGSGGQH